MFPTNGVILTNAGIDLILRALSESIPVVFTTAKIGTGDIDNMDQARNLKDLKKTYKVIGITSISRTSGGLVKIRSSYTNKEFLESVQIKEIGIFAKVSGVEEVLMGYVNDGIGELVPPGNTGNIVERIRDLYIGITEDAKVTAIIDGSIIYATIYDLEEGLNKKSDVGHIHQNATITVSGFMSFNDKGKLDGIEEGANKYIHPNTATIRHVSDSEKATWNGKEPAIEKKTGFNLDKTDGTEDNTAKLFTAKGAFNLLNALTTSINTVATNLSNHILKIVSTAENGHMSKEDKVKLNGIANGANNYIHPDTATVRHVSDAEKVSWNGKEPAIAKKTAFNKDFGTNLNEILEGAKMAELLGCQYGGILNNKNPKTFGVAYYCTSNKSLYRCKKATNLDYANLEFFEGYSHSDFSNKLENLITAYAHNGHTGYEQNSIVITNTSKASTTFKILKQGSYAVFASAYNSGGTTASIEVYLNGTKRVESKTTSTTSISTNLTGTLSENNIIEIRSTVSGNEFSYDIFKI